MLKGIAGRTAVVTGGSGGIGSATARRLHAEGANVVVVDLDGAGAEAVAKELGSKAIGMRADVSSPDDNAAIIARAV
jgi:NAD(P)-dependent dehydrogenase (short-subunit alcohol dehydrogenase family)